MSNDESPSLEQQLAAMQVRHRALDSEIAELEGQPWQDQLYLRRLKKEKLRLKDSISRVRTLLIPDLDA
ncbi:MAG: YdcH family protein [Spongiibacteraceae bacterium]